MLIRNLNIVGIEGTKGILLADDTILSIDSIYSLPDDNEPIIVFENALAFPGLINSHDHLDFDLFPMTANKVYANYVEWAQIYRKITVIALIVP